jgi:hypothetical protein
MTPLRITLPSLGILLALTLPVAASARPQLDEQVEALHREIAALRIAHGLDLDDGQIGQLIPLVEDGIGLRQDLEDLHDANRKTHIAALERVRDDLADDGEIGEQTEQLTQETRKAAEKAMRPVMFELKDLGEEIMALLDGDQRRRVAEAMARMPAQPGHRRPGPPPSDRGDERAQPPQRPALPQALEQGIRRHNGRELFGVVFSEEFLAVLQDMAP